MDAKAAEPSLFHAQAEDGAFVRVSIVGQAPPSLAAYLPARGLTQVRASVDAQPESTLDVSLETELGKAYLESSLGLFAASHLLREVAIHAALIRAGSQLVLLPGASLSGKTTICVAAREAGHEVLGDEYVLVDSQSGRMALWPRPMRIREGMGWRREHLDVETESVTATLVAVLRYDERCGNDPALEIRPLTPGALAVELIANTLCAQLRPEDSLAAALAIARSTPGVLGTRGDAGPALRALLALELRNPAGPASHLP